MEEPAPVRVVHTAADDGSEGAKANTGWGQHAAVAPGGRQCARAHAVHSCAAGGGGGGRRHAKKRAELGRGEQDRGRRPPRCRAGHVRLLPRLGPADEVLLQRLRQANLSDGLRRRPHFCGGHHRRGRRHAQAPQPPYRRCATAANPPHYCLTARPRASPHQPSLAASPVSLPAGFGRPTTPPSGIFASTIRSKRRWAASGRREASRGTRSSLLLISPPTLS